MNYYSGCSPSAQPIGPSTQVWHAERDYPLHLGPQQALVLQLQTRPWPYTPRATIISSSGFLWSGIGVDPRLQCGASNLPRSEEHFGDAIQAPN